MKKTALMGLGLMVITNDQLLSMDYYTVNHKERPQKRTHRHKRTTSQIEFPMIPLEQFVISFSTKNTVFEQLKERPSMKALLAKVPMEDFFSHILKISGTREKSSYYVAELEKTEEIFHFLAAAKIELELEKADIDGLATKYKFEQKTLIANAISYGITDFGRHFPETQASTPDSVSSTI